jgi:signal transduction histidine kinase
VTDAMMPGLDGFGLCAEVRQDPKLRDVPIVMLTSTYVDEADRELGRKAGANEFVIRTPALVEMISALESVLAPSAVPAAAAVAQSADFEREHASRTLVQLERQAAAASSARQQCATLSAELAVLNAISEAITQHSDIDLVLREILAACCDAGGVSVGALSLANDDGTFRTVLVGSIDGVAGADWFISDGALLKRFIGERRAVLISRDSAEADVRDWMQQRGLQTAVVVTLQHKDDTLGALVMLSEGRDLASEDRLLFAESVGHQVSNALALAQAFDDTATAAQVAREHARLLQSVFTTIADPIVVADAEGRATTWNAAVEKLVPMPPPMTVLDPGWSARAGAFTSDKTTLFQSTELPLARALRGDNVDNLDIFLKNAQKPEGAWLRASARPLRDDTGAVSGAVAVARDITKERLTSEQLMVSDRMASIGLMAAGVGHEINNPLSAVVANLEMASTEIDALIARVGREQLGDLPEEIREALEAAERVRRIALDLKLFSGGQADENAPVDVERVLESSLRMAWSQVRQRARVVKQYGGVPLVSGVESRLGQVFLNLIVNAAQAIPEGDVERQEIRLVTAVDREGSVVVSVEDTGSGIPHHVMAQLFTPFVTTKAAGVGTGLGLSICQRLVTAMGGSIWAESDAGRGTVFHVALQPASARPPAMAATPATATTAAADRHARILVVDDEELIGMLLRRVFKAHAVTVLSNAKDALAAIAAGARYDAILCDLNMPIMSGMEFYENLSRRFPDQARALIFLTGGAHNKETVAFLETVTNVHVEKPFDAAKLRDRVDAHLTARPTGTRPPEAA